MNDESPVSHLTILYFEDKIASIDTCLKVIAVTLILGLSFAVGVVAHTERWFG